MRVRILAALAACVALAGVAPAQTATPVPVAAVQPATGQDGSLWYALAPGNVEVGCDVSSYTAAFKRPGGAVTPLPLAGAFYSYAQMGL